MIIALERDEPGVLDHRRNEPALVEGHAGVAHGMEYERRTRDLRQQRHNVDRIQYAHEPPGIDRRRRKPLELVEPLMLLRRSIGNELRGEELSERRILLAPAELGELDHHVGLFTGFCGARPFEPTTGV